MTWQLGIDVGTTATAAALAREGADAAPIALGDSMPTIPSAVAVMADGTLVAGDDAWAVGAAEPSAVVAAPKARLGASQPLTAGGRTLGAEELFAGLVRSLVERAAAAVGTRPDHVTLTHPGGWTP